MNIDSPERNHVDSKDFYTSEEAKRYENNSGMKKTQTELTNIALNLFINETRNTNKNIWILDVGCGTGFSLEFLRANGYRNLIGIEPAREMLNICKNKKFESYQGSFEEIPMGLKNKKFEFIISISSLQWVLTNKSDMQIKNNIKAIGKVLKEILQKEGMIIFQYYPPEENTTNLLISSFERAGFFVSEYIYNKGNLKKQKFFLIIRHK